MGPEDILDTYRKEAARWARERGQSLWEAPLLQACVGRRGGSRHVLDLGCGSGQPIAQWFVEHGHHVLGVDGAPEMIEEMANRVPKAQGLVADMRTLSLGRRYDIILAFNSFFHLSPDDQRAMFPIFARHASAGARLLFTSGPDADERVGQVGDSPVYHASLAPEEYRTLLADNGFKVMWFRPEDAQFRGHTVWLARFPGPIRS
jgi:SAM-dependent methyltransferase